MRKVILGIAVGMLLMAPLPLIADHTFVSTQPVGGVALRIYPYPHQALALTACDGSETVDWRNARVEVDVLKGYGPGPIAQEPSERFSERLTIYTVTPQPNGDESIRYVWQTLSRGQGIAAHHSSSRWEASQNNQSHAPLTGALVLWEARVIGEVSGNEFVATCRYRIADVLEDKR